MTIATISLGRRDDFNRIFTGYSKQPRAVDVQIIETQARLKEAASNQPLVLALNQLGSIYKECSIDDWDGCGALPVSEGAVSEATRSLELLSNSNLPMPQISPEVDGGIEFEWYMSSDHLFTVSFNGKKILGYSGMFGEGNTFYGTSKVDSQIPAIIRWNISKFT